MSRFYYIVEERTNSDSGFAEKLGCILIVLFVVFSIGISLLTLTAGPKQRYIYDQTDVQYKHKKVEVHIFELGGLYNIIKGRHYRVDYIGAKNKVIKSVYYDDRNKINKHYFGLYMDGEWGFEKIDQFPFNL